MVRSSDSGSTDRLLMQLELRRASCSGVRLCQDAAMKTLPANRLIREGRAGTQRMNSKSHAAFMHADRVKYTSTGRIVIIDISIRKDPSARRRSLAFTTFNTCSSSSISIVISLQLTSTFTNSLTRSRQCLFSCTPRPVQRLITNTSCIVYPEFNTPPRGTSALAASHSDIDHYLRSCCSQLN